MSVFGDYSKYYNLLYRDKNYEAEANYVDGLIKSYLNGARTMLEFGCGTGNYTREFSRLGYDVCGVDLSEGMLDEARRNCPHGIEFLCGDVRSARLGKKFDVVSALFHVLSYQVSNRDVLDALKTIREHLVPGGVAIFDFWYGPGVLTLRPEMRVKEAEDEKIRITRLAVPVLHPNENTVDVNYKAFIEDKISGEIKQLKECHRMRYFFEPELSFIYSFNNIQLLHNSEWLTDETPGIRSWSVVNVIRGIS